MNLVDVPQLSIERNNNRFSATIGAEIRFIDRSFALPDMRYRLLLQYLYTFEIIGGLVVGIGSIAYALYKISTLPPIITRETLFWFPGSPYVGILWFGVLCLLFLAYRTSRHKRRPQNIPPVASENGKLVHRHVWEYFTQDTQHAVERAVTIAHEWSSESVRVEHVFAALLEQTRIRAMLIRLGLPIAAMQESLKKQLTDDAASAVGAGLSAETMSTLLHSYQLAIDAHLPEIDVTELLMSTIMHSSYLQTMLYDLEITLEKLDNMLAWLRIQAELERRRTRQARGGAHMSKHGIDRAMTAVATPYLNQFSTDITHQVKAGVIKPCVARETELQDIFRIIESGRPNILLIGPRGVGKRAIIEGIAARMVADDVPKIIHDKRLVEISVSSLVAGTTVAGAEERLLRMITEIKRAGNIIVFIDNLEDLVDPADTGVDLAKTLAEVTSNGLFYTFATTTPEGYTKQIANSAIGSTLAEIDVAQMSHNQAIQVLESKAPYIEYRQQVFFTYQALEAAVTLADNYIQQQIIPESAIGILTESASVAKAGGKESILVTAAHVGEVVSKKTGIPVSAITDDESTKLLKLEEALHERVVGQDEAVQLVSNALRRARANIRATNRPIANFLFLGPTGVGKTELAKTIAAVYFGGEERMIRIDMSEYQDTAAVYRLIGQPGQQGTGILTEAVREQPFSLILLDELEKADPQILNIFLQVFDDGRLTDSVGRTVDFTNSIIIATSNAATSYVQSELTKGTSYETIQQSLLHGQLQEYYRPEFLNRFDGIVLFRALKEADIQKIAALLLQRVAADLETRGLGLEVDPGAYAALARVGFDPTFGARPMRRAIQDHIENPIATVLLERTAKRRDTIVVGPDLSLSVRQHTE